MALYEILFFFHKRKVHLLIFIMLKKTTMFTVTDLNCFRLDDQVQVIDILKQSRITKLTMSIAKYVYGPLAIILYVNTSVTQLLSANVHEALNNCLLQTLLACTFEYFNVYSSDRVDFFNRWPDTRSTI